MFFSAKKISRKSVFYNLSAIAVSNTILQMMGFAYRIFLSRVAGAEGLGVYQLVMPAYSVISSLTLSGLTVAVARLTAAQTARGNHIGARKCVSGAKLIFSVAMIIISFVCLNRLEFISEKLLGDGRTALALPFLLVCLFLTGIENIYKNYFYGVGKVIPQIISELSEQVIRALAVAFLLFTVRVNHAGVCAMLIVLGMVISELFSSTLLTFFYRAEKKKLSSVARAKFRYTEILKISIPVSFAATANNILASLNSVLIPRRLMVSGLARVNALESFGIMFGMTMPLLTFPIAFMASLTSIMVPKISEERESGNYSEMRRKAGKTIHATSLLAMPCMAVLIPLGKPVCTLLFSHPEAGEYMLLLCIATLFSYYEMTTGALLNGIGKEKISAAYIIIGGMIQLLFTYSVGFPDVGMYGFVVGYLVSCGIVAVLNFLCLKKTLKLRPRYSNWFLSPLLASALAALLAKIVFDLLINNSAYLITAVVASLVLAVAVYAIALSALGCNIVKYIKTLIPKNE